MKKKLEFILNELIKNYLVLKEPISSSTLKKLSNLKVSPSTIRGYFQALEEIGMVDKEHFASGSYPTKQAMELFWQNHFPREIDFSIEDLEKKADEFEIVVIVEMFENELLNKVYNFKDKYIILEFEQNEIILRYSKELFKFFKSLEKLDTYNMFSLLKHYNLGFLLEKFEIFKKEFTFNKKLLYNKFNEVDINFFNKTDMDLVIKKEFLMKKYSCLDKSSKIDMILIGDIYSDFLSFFEILKGGDNEEKKEDS